MLQKGTGIQLRHSKFVSYKLNKSLGGHFIAFCVALRSCNYLYDDNTQAEYVKLVCDFVARDVLWWHVSTARYENTVRFLIKKSW